MVEPRRLPVYAVAICDGGGCAEVLVIDDAETPRQAVRRLALVARALREQGALGTLVLTEEATDRVVAARRVWPSPREEGVACGFPAAPAAGSPRSSRRIAVVRRFSAWLRSRLPRRGSPGK